MPSMSTEQNIKPTIEETIANNAQALPIYPRSPDTMKKSRRSNAPSPDEEVASPARKETAVESIEDGGEVGKGRGDGKMDIGNEATAMADADDAENGGKGDK